MNPAPQKLRKFIHDNSMSIALFSLFLICVIGQSVTGWRAYEAILHQEHLPAISYGAYLGTGNFLDGAFSNWQAALLQLAVLIAFSSVLRQKGAAHSRKEDAPNRRTLNLKLQPRDSLGQWIKANSLSIAFFVLFVILFCLHAVFGGMANNETQMFEHLPPLTLRAYVVSASFWFTVLQCWEAEFAVIGLYIVFSIFLRQENSPESKPVEARDSQTGGPNE